MNQSADIIFDPDGLALKLMLNRPEGRGKSPRPWARKRLTRKLPTTLQSTLESAVVWESWHLGDGYSRIDGAGKMPPVEADGTNDNRYPFYLRLPPKRTQIASTAVAPTRVFRHAGVMWVIGDDGVNLKLYKLDASFAVASSTNLALTGVLCYSVASFDGVCYIAIGFSNSIWTILANGTTIAQAASATARWKYMVVSQDRLWFSTGDTTVKACPTGQDATDPTTWSGPFTTGDASQPLTGLLALGRVLYMLRPDGINVMDPDFNVVNLLPDLAQYTDAQNGAGAIVWHGGLLFPHQRGLFLYNSIGFGIPDLTPCGPETVRTNGTYATGKVIGLVSDGAWIWMRTYTAHVSRGGNISSGYNYQIWMGRQRASDEPGDGFLIWFLLGEYQTPFGIDGINNPLFNTGTGIFFADNDKAYYITTDVDGYAPQGPSAGSFQTSGDSYMPVVAMGHPLIDKYLRSVEIDAENLSVTNTVTVAYALNPINASPTFTALGAVITDTTMGSSAGRQELNFPTNTVARSIALKISLAGSATSSPLIRRIAITYAERFRKNGLWVAICRIGNGIADRFGEEIHYDDTQIILDQLYTYEEQSTAVVILDPTENRRNVLVIDVDVVELEDEDPTGDPYQQATISFVVVP